MSRNPCCKTRNFSFTFILLVIYVNNVPFEMKTRDKDTHFSGKFQEKRQEISIKRSHGHSCIRFRPSMNEAVRKKKSQNDF